MSYDLTTKYVSKTFQNLLQRTGSDNRLYDLEGNEIGDLRISGSLTAQQYIVSSSVTNVTIAYNSGSNIFGDTHDDIHRFTGSLDVSGSLYVSASGNVGIGTTTPTSPASVAKFLHIQDSAHAGIVLEDTVGTSAWDIFANGDDLKFKYNNVNQMLLDGSGNVGIGTTSPTKELQVTGDISASGDIYLQNDDSIKFARADGTVQDVLKVDTGDNLNIGHANLDDIVFTSDDGEAMRIKGDTSVNFASHITASGNISASGTGDHSFGGKVGIGTASPNELLHVQSDSNQLAQFTSTDERAVIEISDNATFGYIVAESNRFQMGGSSSLNTHNLTVRTDSGNVGIGTTNPDTELHILGEDELTLKLDATSGQPAILFAEGDNDKWKMRAETNKFQLHDYTAGEWVFNVISEKVGIGTQNPTKTLQVEGDISSSGFISTLSHITSSGNISSSASGSFKAVHILDITSTSTGQKFHVGRSMTAGLSISDTDATSYISSIQDENEAGFGNLTFVADDGGDNDGYFSFNGSSGGERVRIDDSGNVGIGTQNPTKTLQVEGSISASGDIITTGDIIAQNYITRTTVSNITQSFSSGSTIFGDSIDDTHVFSGSITQIHTGSGVGFFLTGSELRVEGDISASGTATLDKIIIGAISAPFSDDLYLGAEAGYSVNGWRTGTAGTYVGKLAAAGGVLSIQADGNRDIKFGASTPGTTMFIDTSAHEVGIGTDVTGSLSSTLTVSGSIHASGSPSTAVGNITADGNISGSSTSTGSFGKVGIATTTPDAFLHILGGDENTLKLDATTGQPAIYFAEADVNKWEMRGGANEFGLYDYNDSKWHFYIKSGNVGIGTKLPSQVLTVSGSIHASGSATSTVGNIIADGNISGSSTSTGSFGNGYIDGKLTIGGAINSAIAVNVETDVDYIARFKSTDNKGYIAISDDDTSTYISAENDAMSLGHTTGISAGNLNIRPNGHVAIGNKAANASTALVVSGSIHASGSATSTVGNILADGNISASGTGSFSNLRVVTSATGAPCAEFIGTNPRIEVKDSNNSVTATFSAPGTSVNIGASTNHVVKLQQNASSVITLNTNKMVGIRTSIVPSQVLTVSGSIHASGSASTTVGNIIADGNISGSSTSTGSFGTLKLDGAAVDFTGLPTSDPGIAGRLWNDSNTLKISAG